MSDHNQALNYAQPSLPTLTHHMRFLTLHLKQGARGAETYERLQVVARALQTQDGADGQRRQVLISVSPPLWASWCESLQIPLPLAMNDEARERMLFILNRAPPYAYDGGELFFHIKADSDEAAEALLATIDNELGDITERRELTAGNAEREGHVYGRRILHGLIRSVDPVNLSARALVGDEDPLHKGSCYGITQRFVHDWQAIGRMSELEIENMIGRDHQGNLVPNSDERSHLKRARVKDRQGLNHRILTQGQPYGDAPGYESREAGVYVAAYARSLDAISDVLQSMLGPLPDAPHPQPDADRFILDKHLTVSTSNQGSCWYVPNAAELGLQPRSESEPVPINPFFVAMSKNGIMPYNTKEYLHREGRQPGADNKPLSARILELLGNTFSRWHNNWYEPRTYPDLGHLREHLQSGERLTDLSIPERKGRSIQLMLGQVLSGFDPATYREADMFRVDPREIVVGVVPPFTLGTGIRVMRYLDEAEQMEGKFMSLDETSMAGHIVADYRTLVSRGLASLRAEAATKAADSDGEKRWFYNAVDMALQGAQQWFRNYAELARRGRDRLCDSQTFERSNLEAIATRMDRLATDTPQGLLDAAQLVFGFYCCLHLVGELTSLGRLDQTLQPFLDADDIDRDQAQEIIDALCIKLDEQVMMNRQFFPDDRTFGTCAVPGAGGANVPQGDKASQWVMQMTLGGYQGGEGDPVDACNTLTELFLHTARRLPLNAPFMNLRVNPQTPERIVELTALALRNGGALPTLVGDDDHCESMQHFGLEIPLADARDYCQDGCWEPIVDGKSAFALTYTPVLASLEAALNRGATYITAGPTYLRGDNVSFQSKPAEEFTRFEEFLETFYEHYRWQAAGTMSMLIGDYGNLWKICPSPLLSALIDGCLESGHDLTNGGARYNILSPMILGVPCLVDSLWAIRQMVFNPATAVTSLAELRDCLLCDWGHDMIEPLQNSEAGPLRADLRSERYKQLRETALGLPKFGSGHAGVDCFAGEVSSRLGKIFSDTLDNPAEAVSPGFAERLRAVNERFSKAVGRPHRFKLIPGYGTFEDYLGLGMGAGASADGRRKGATLSSNMSAMPSPSDRPPEPRPRPIVEALKGWNGSSFNYARNIPGPVDIDIAEEFPQAKLEQVIRDFARGELGFNFLTVNCNNLETLQAAVENPERYDLLRQRMGGWTEVYVCMFPGHQQQHMRRPLFVADEEESALSLRPPQ